MTTTRLSRLQNGLRVISQAMPGIETAAVALFADTGARHEQAAENGLAHFFEHMVFKGTRQRSARAIAEAIEDVGGMLNAWTSRDTTCFHARVMAEHLPLATELISGLITEPTFADSDVELERQVVLSEIGEALEAPDDLVFDQLQDVAFPEQSLGRPVLGTADSLAHLGADNLRGWRAHQYRGGGLILAAAGKVDHGRLLALAEKYLGGLPAGRPEGLSPAQWRGGQRMVERPSEQLHMTLGWQGFAANDERQLAAKLFAAAIGGGMSSRLFQSIRENQGLAYSISASHSLHADTGMLSIYAATKAEDAPAALDEARRIVRAACDDLSPAELARAKAQMKAAMQMALEGCAAQADWLAGSLLTWGRIIEAGELIGRIERLSVEEVRATGAAMLATNEALAAVGPQLAISG